MKCATKEAIAIVLLCNVLYSTMAHINDSIYVQSAIFSRALSVLKNYGMKTVICFSLLEVHQYRIIIFKHHMITQEMVFTANKH